MPRSSDGTLIGYLLYAPSQNRLRVVQLCISEEFRGCGIARKLVEELKASCYDSARHNP